MTSRTGAIRAQWEGTHAENLAARIFGYSHRLREVKMTKFRRNYVRVMTILVTGLMSSNPTIAAGGQSVPYMVKVRCEEQASNTCLVSTPKVPGGKRLILEHINSTAQLRDPAGVQSWFVSVGVGPGNVMATLIPHLVVDIPPLSNFAANESVLVFVEAGQSIVANIDATSVGVNMDMLLSGYIVDQ
jgi:hypothetical protein